MRLRGGLVRSMHSLSHHLESEHTPCHIPIRFTRSPLPPRGCHSTVSRHVTPPISNLSHTYHRASTASRHEIRNPPPGNPLTPSNHVQSPNPPSHPITKMQKAASTIAPLPRIPPRGRAHTARIQYASHTHAVAGVDIPGKEAGTWALSLSPSRWHRSC